MALFDDLKQKILGTASTVADKSVEFARNAADKAVEMGKIAKLKGEIEAENISIKKNYAAIGKLYYEKFKDAADEDFAQVIDEIKASFQKIADKNGEINALKAVEDVAEDVKEKVEDAVEAAGDKVEEVKETVAEVAEEIKEEAAEKVEEIKEDISDIGKE